MGWIKFKGKVFALLFLLAVIGLVALWVGPCGGSLGRGALRLPVGEGTPVIRLGERHGLILASDGSLWSWGSDCFGWPVLGLGNLADRSATLRRIGKDADWVSISASAVHNLAIKSDG